MSNGDNGEDYIGSGICGNFNIKPQTDITNKIFLKNE